MGFNFPSPATEGQVVTFVEGPSYVYQGGAWNRYNIGSTATALARNRIVNGAMQISQENGNTTGTTNAYYPADQFLVSFVTSSAIINITRVNPIAGGGAVTPNGSYYRLRAGIPTADTSLTTNERLQFRTVIEGGKIADCGWGTAAARKFVLRFGWKSPAGTFSVSLHNSDTTRSYIAQFTVSAGQANVDTEQVIVIPGDTAGTWLSDTGIGIQINWNAAVGPSLVGVAGWQSSAAPGLFGMAGNSNGLAGANDRFELFDVGLYLDPDNTGLAPKWEMPDEAEELRACQRYWEKNAGSGNTTRFNANVTSGTAYSVNQLFSTVKRAAPAVALTNIYNLSFPVTVGSTGIDAAGFYEVRTANATGAGQFNSNWVANARM